MQEKKCRSFLYSFWTKNLRLKKIYKKIKKKLLKNNYLIEISGFDIVIYVINKLLSILKFFI